MEQKSAQQVKTYFGEDIRRFSFSTFTYNDLVAQLKKVYDFENNTKIILKYEDEDKDLITVSSDQELQASLTHSKKLLRFRISTQPEEKNVAIIEVEKKEPIASADKKEATEEKTWKQKRKNNFCAKLVKSETSCNLIAAPSTQVIKTWKIRNESEENWPEGCILTFHKGDMMGGPASISVPRVAPGQEVDLSVTLTSPTELGRYKGVWKLTAPAFLNRKGENFYKKFGPALKVKIQVSDDSSSKTNKVESLSDSSSSSSEEEKEFKKRRGRHFSHKQMNGELKKRERIEDMSAILAQLETMGFNDKEYNIKLVKRTHGDVDKVVKLLKKKNKLGK